MANKSNIVVEVIVWDGCKKKDNPYGHVSTKIIVGKSTYSYSLEMSFDPKVVCNTKAFTTLEKNEQKFRDGVGFILNLTHEQAQEIFDSMNIRFHAYNKRSCAYHMLWHNCTYAIQESIEKVGIDLYAVNHGRTLLPAKVGYALLKTRNNSKPLVKDIIKYKKGQNKGTPVTGDKTTLLFELTASHEQHGWHTNGSYTKSENW